MRVGKSQQTVRALFTFDFAVPEREVVQARVELAPGVSFGRHRHSGDEIVYVIEGSLEYQLENQPPVTLNAGDVLSIPAGTIHSVKNVGNGAEPATYVVGQAEADAAAVARTISQVP